MAGPRLRFGQVRMHELSIAMSIVEMAQEEVERRGAGASASGASPAGTFVGRDQRSATFFVRDGV